MYNRNMISERYVRRYCSEDLSLIENYDRAAADLENIWDLHHRAEILPCGKFSINDLKTHGLYWRRPAAELVFLPHSEHLKLHMKGRRVSDQTRRKMSDAWKGHSLSEETKRKISSSLKGRRVPERTRLKIS